MQEEQLLFYEPMTFEDAHKRGYTITYTSPNKDGYHVVYRNGTHGWIPQALFKQIYIKDK